MHRTHNGLVRGRLAFWREGLTGVVVAVADDEDEQQHGEDGCKQHPPYRCSDHRRQRAEGWLRCNTSNSYTWQSDTRTTKHATVATLRVVAHSGSQPTPV